MSQPIHTSIKEEGRPHREKVPVAKKLMSGNSKEDEIANILEKSLSTLRSGLLQDIKIDDLVFCEPSKEGDPHTPPPLQTLATTNTQFLEYQDWIKKLSVEAENLDCEVFESCRNIKCQLLDDLRNEWTKLEKLKRSAWQLTFRNGSTIPPRPQADPGLVQIIDTCEY